jgi:hypothetical protein
MRTRFRIMSIAAALAATAALFAAPAQAGTSFSVQIGGGVPYGYGYSQPGYVYPQPGYVYAQPSYGYVQPSYGYVQPSYVYTEPSYNVYYGNQQRSNRGWVNRRDRDHDGIPNRFDRDRDGDGVPNRLDRNPDNRRRF